MSSHNAPFFASTFAFHSISPHLQQTLRTHWQESERCIVKSEVDLEESRVDVPKLVSGTWSLDPFLIQSVVEKYQRRQLDVVLKRDEDEDVAVKRAVGLLTNDKHETYETNETRQTREPQIRGGNVENENEVDMEMDTSCNNMVKVTANVGLPESSLPEQEKSDETDHSHFKPSTEEDTHDDTSSVILNMPANILSNHENGLSLIHVEETCLVTDAPLSAAHLPSNNIFDFDEIDVSPRTSLCSTLPDTADLLSTTAEPSENDLTSLHEGIKTAKKKFSWKQFVKKTKMKVKTSAIVVDDEKETAQISKMEKIRRKVFRL